MIRRALILSAALALTACGGDDSTDADTAAPATPRASQTTSAAPEPSDEPSPEPTADRCLVVPVEKMQEVIASGVEDGVGQMTFKAASAVKSEDFENIYMVAGRFDVPGVEGEVGVWATNNIEPLGGGLIMSVDGLAQEFTVWPDADSTDARITSSDDGVSQARACLGG